LIAEVVLRVHPLPEDSATLVAASSAGQAADATRNLLASALEPAAVDWVGDPREAAGRLAVRFEGSRPGVAAQLAAAAQVLDLPSLEQLTGAAETACWQDLAAAHRTPPGQTGAGAGTLPSQLAAVADHPARLASHTALGLHTAHFAGSPDTQLRAFEEWRESVLALGGTVLLRDRPDEVDAAVDALGPPPPAVQLLRAVKAQLDPDGRCAAGRLGRWLP
jgi:glycolate oxidase FAD binding subunit